MATVFFKKDSLSERDTPYQTRIFPTVDGAQAWVHECKGRNRWFTCQHVSALNVNEMPLYLVVSHESGKYMSILQVVEECSIGKGDEIIVSAWRWATASKRVSAYSTNGSIFSATAAPTYIDIFAKGLGLETLSYVLLGPCQRPVEGVDMELAAVLLAKRPSFECGRFPQEAELEELKHFKLVTKKVRERTAELEAAKAAFNSASDEAAELFQATEVQAWYDQVLRLCLPE